MPSIRYTFSGHESFPCRTLWLKKGYDFVVGNNDFNAPDAVIRLGVGKNMVSSIKYWMRAFCIYNSEGLSPLSKYLLDSSCGKDPYMEDLGTLWLLHFLLVSSKEATLYNLLFLGLQSERTTFDKLRVTNYVRRIMSEDGKLGQFNENTVSKDFNTLIQMYALPKSPKSFDDYSSLLIDLDLVREDSEGKGYVFNVEGKREIPWQVFLYAVIMSKGTDQTVSYDVLQDIGKIFCMTDMEVIDMCRRTEEHCNGNVRYSDTAGVRQLLFLVDLTTEDVLNEYYG